MRDSHMAMFFLVALLIGSCVSLARGEEAGSRGGTKAGDRPAEALLAQASPDSEWVKQVLRLQYTEFCATVRPPPAALMTAVQEGAKAGNTDAQIAFMWLLRIQERYKENGCGET